jgi:hypothetical protein
MAEMHTNTRIQRIAAVFVVGLMAAWVLGGAVVVIYAARKYLAGE